VSHTAYWLSSYTWDVLSYAVIGKIQWFLVASGLIFPHFFLPLLAVISVLILIFFGIDKLVGAANFTATITVLSLFGLSVTSYAYFFSFAFASPSTGNVVCLFVFS
jgi:hypothetical protein